MSSSKKPNNKAIGTIRKKEHSKKTQVKRKRSLDNYKWDTSQFLEPFDYKSIYK